jgi:hypothetical protein
MVGVHNEAIYPHCHEMIHCIRDDWPTPDFEERLRAMLGQGAKPFTQSCTQNKSRFEASSFQYISRSFNKSS